MMDNYSKYMKHWKNHSKDRFTQQCGGPVHEPDSSAICCGSEIERMSFVNLINRTKVDDFPVYVTQGSGGIWSFTNERNSFGTRIDSMADMQRFLEDYIW